MQFVIGVFGLLAMGLITKVLRTQRKQKHRLKVLEDTLKEIARNINQMPHEIKEAKEGEEAKAA
jgi:uncharacterized membrane-anchored protein YhcB (DUF1043 family)